MILPVIALIASAVPWPAEPDSQAIDLTSLVPGTVSGFGQQVSDLFWNPLTRTLWVSRAPGGVWALREAADGGFEVAASYPTINSDYEGITQAELSDSTVFMLDETGGAIRKFAVTSAGAATLVRTWSLAGVIPPQSGNAGPEGLTFVPDLWLLDAGFPLSATDAGGLFLIAHQSGGFVYAVDLDPLDGNGRTLIARLSTSRSESSALAFDRSSGQLFVSHNTGGNFLEVGRLGRLDDGGLVFNAAVELGSPNTSNLEGFAVTPQYGPDGGAPGERWCFFADDDGNSVGRPGLLWFRKLPASLRAVRGEGQRAGPLQPLELDPAVELRDVFGTVYVGLAIDFAVTGGGGNLSAATTTSAEGIASVRWTLGAAGAQEMTATAPGFGLAPVVFSAVVDGGTVDAGTPDAGTEVDGGTEPPIAARGCGCGAGGGLGGLLALALFTLRRRKVTTL